MAFVWTHNLPERFVFPSPRQNLTDLWLALLIVLLSASDQRWSRVWISPSLSSSLSALLCIQHYSGLTHMERYRYLAERDTETQRYKDRKQNERETARDRDRQRDSNHQDFRDIQEIQASQSLKSIIENKSTIEIESRSYRG